MMMERALKILMTGGLAVLCALIAIGNFSYPDLNERFVQHVLSMDTVEGPIAVHGLRSPLVWEVGFWSIVAGETLTAAFFAWGAVELARARSSKARVFHEAKRFVYAGAGCAFVIWFVGFSAVGGEWFAMWQSHVWNGTPEAFRIFASILLISIFIALSDCEIG
jgi:predicted small integral membrane protein